MTGIIKFMIDVFFSKKIIFCFFLLIAFFISKTQAVPIAVKICTNHDFLEERTETKLLKLKCKKSLRKNHQIKIDSLKNTNDKLNYKMFAAVQVGKLIKIWDKNKYNDQETLEIHWIFYPPDDDPSESESETFKPENTYWESQNKRFIDNTFEKKQIADDMHKGSSLQIFWSVVEVLITVRDSYRTVAEKKIDPNFHIGKWKVEIYKGGSLEGKEAMILFEHYFEIVE